MAQILKKYQGFFKFRGQEYSFEFRLKALKTVLGIFP